MLTIFFLTHETLFQVKIQLTGNSQILIAHFFCINSLIVLFTKINTMTETIQEMIIQEYVLSTDGFVKVLWVMISMDRMVKVENQTEFIGRM